MWNVGTKATQIISKRHSDIFMILLGAIIGNLVKIEILCNLILTLGSNSKYEVAGQSFIFRCQRFLETTHCCFKLKSEGNRQRYNLNAIFKWESKHCLIIMQPSGKDTGSGCWSFKFRVRDALPWRPMEERVLNCLESQKLRNLNTVCLLSPEALPALLTSLIYILLQQPFIPGCSKVALSPGPQLCLSLPGWHFLGSAQALLFLTLILSHASQKWPTLITLSEATYLVIPFSLVLFSKLFV